MIFTDLQRELGRRVLQSLEHFFQSRDHSMAALAYSGGIDSSLLLLLSAETVVPYTLGDKNSKDYANSLEGSGKLGYQLVSVPMESVDIEKYVKIVRSIDPGIGKKDLGYETVLAILLDRIREDLVITGQGADEIFYGYNIFREEPQMDNRGHMNKLFKETLPREEKIAEYFGKELVTPYISGGVPAIMENADRDDNFSEGSNKAILRAAAALAGLPNEIVERRKTAAQYGSGLMRKLKALPVWSSL